MGSAGGVEGIAASAEMGLASGYTTAGREGLRADPSVAGAGVADLELSTLAMLALSACEPFRLCPPRPSAPLHLGFLKPHPALVVGGVDEVGGVEERPGREGMEGMARDGRDGMATEGMEGILGMLEMVGREGREGWER